MIADLINYQKEYINVLEEELNEVVPLAFAHGWKSSRSEIGFDLRAKIANSMIQEEFCRNCKYYVVDGTCRKNPPVFVGGYQGGQFPHVYGEDWCGCFESVVGELK